MCKLKEKLKSKIAPMRQEIKELIKTHGDVVVGDITVSQAYGGMRDIKALVCDTSELDPQEGIRFRGFSIPEIVEKLPRAKGSNQPLPEAIFYLLLVGEVPTQAETEEITAELQRRAILPQYVYDVLRAMPTDTHPMTQFSTAILVMQHESLFAKEYEAGLGKNDFWDATFEDTLNILATVPMIAAYIYRRCYKGDTFIPPDPTLDWGANFAHMMGVDNPEFYELMRLYLVIHSDHEGGNVSAHTTHLVGSALSDAYYCLSAGMNGLAGPLHGLANQEVLRWIMNLKKKLGGGVPTKAQLEEEIESTLLSGQVIPGYGHAVLRKTDPRYTAQREFALKNLPNDEIFQIVSMLYECVPPILLKHGKAKNPWPNVDAHSGCILQHYGVTEFDFYTVLFGVSRTMGVLSYLIWDRILNMPLERPKSITTEWVKELVAKKS